MKLSSTLGNTTRIERMLEEVEAALAPPPRPRVMVVTNDTDNEAEVKEKKEKALAEHIAAHPEHAGRTIKDVQWVVVEVVHRRPSAAEISEAAAATQDEISKGEIEDEFPLNGCKGTDGPSETPEPIDLPPPDPGCLARSKPWRPVHQRAARDQRRPTWKKWER